MSDGLKKIVIIAVIALVGGFVWKTVFQTNGKNDGHIKVDQVVEIELKKELKEQDKKIGELLVENNLLKKSQIEKSVEQPINSEKEDVDKENDELIINFLDKLFSYDSRTGKPRLTGLEKFVSTDLLEEIKLDSVGEEDYHTHTEDQAITITIESLKIYSYDKEEYIITYNTFFEFESGAKTSLECVASIKIGDNVVTEWDQFVTNVIK